MLRFLTSSKAKASKQSNARTKRVRNSRYSLMKHIRIVSTLALLLAPLIAHAGARRFTNVYEATTAAPGAFEVENWVTWKTDRDGDSRYRQLDFRHEVEF